MRRVALGRAYVQACRKVAERRTRRIRGTRAQRFVALEVEVGPWAGFYYSGEISILQYAAFTGRSAEAIKLDLQYMRTLVAFWKDAGCVSITENGYARILDRMLRFQGNLQSDERVRLFAEAMARKSTLRTGYERSPERYIPYGPTRPQSSCIVGDYRSSHGNGCCVICAVPVPWETLIDELGRAYPADPRGVLSPNWRGKKGLALGFIVRPDPGHVGKADPWILGKRRRFDQRGDAACAEEG